MFPNFSNPETWDQPMSPSKKLRTKQSRRSVLQRQKDSRYKVLSRRRFNSCEFWDDSKDTNDSGYQSDQSVDSRCSSLNLDQISQNDMLKGILYCESEAVLNKAVSAALIQADALQYEELEEMAEKFFNLQILNRISSFIGQKTVRHSIQIKIIKVYEEFVAKTQLSEKSVENLINSSVVPKLTEVLVSGNEVMVERSLNLLLMTLEVNSSVQFLTHLLDSGFVDAMSVRTDLLRWRTPRANAFDLKTNRRQLVSEKNMSSVARVLFRQFAGAISRLIGNDMCDVLRGVLFTKTTPLLTRLLSSPDPKVIPPVVDCLRMFIESNRNFCPLIAETFCQTLFPMALNNVLNEENLIFPFLRLFNTMMASTPQLFSHQIFASNLISYLNRIVEQKRYSHRFDKEIIEIIGQTGDQTTNDQTIRQMGDCLNHLSDIVFKSEDRYNRIIALDSIDAILCKYSFESFLTLLSVFDIRGHIVKLMVSNDKHQESGLKVIDHILSILSASFDSMTEDVERVKTKLFGKKTDLYYCLEKVSFKTSNQMLSNKAHHLLLRIDSKAVNDEDKSLVPQINDKGFVFGPNF